MKYKKRLIENTLLKASQHFPVIVVTGARQVGKTTLLQHLLGTDNTVTFDPLIDIGNARSDPEMFLNNTKTPVILDEIQFSPQLLTVIKRKVDEQKQNGLYWLTGSQNFALMRNVSESLAGRAAILSLHPMTLSELHGNAHTWINNYLLEPQQFLTTDIKRIAHDHKSMVDLIWEGGFPGLINVDRNTIYLKLSSYFATYIERDLRLLGEISDLQQFAQFVQIMANLTAQEVNHSQLGRELGITGQTAKRWLSLLSASYHWSSLPAFSGNTLKRISGKPKGYFSDTGLASYLMRISSPDALLGHPRLGALFETYVAQDILKQVNALTMNPAVYHWRTTAGAEVDLVLELNNTYYLIEIKCKTQITKADARGIRAFKETYPKLNLGPSLIIAPVQQKWQLEKDVYVIPYDL